jgi:hypothetical protein
LCVLGCGGTGGARAVRPDAPDKDAAAKALELYDANHDGFLDAKEVEKAPGLKAAFEQIDKDHAGKISSDQIAARIKWWAETKVGRVHVQCFVTHNGKPLAGAKVLFVPEKFLGDALQPGSGTTNQGGLAGIASPYAEDPTVRGLSPGFYRVEISKEGEKIPAKYGAETVLGAEIAPSSPKTAFELVY